MLFELFITIHLQMQFMSEVISTCHNTKFEYHAKLKQIDPISQDFLFKHNI
jgi:hypothetical protein